MTPVDEEPRGFRLARPIEDLRLTTRVYNALKRADINTCGQVTEMTRDKLMRVHRLGPYSVAEIEGKLHAMGLGLSEAVS